MNASHRPETGGGSILPWIVLPLLIMPLAFVAGRLLRATNGTKTTVSETSEPVGAASARDALRPRVSRGEIVYQTYCAKCHGTEGHGDGESAAQLAVRPRDFAGPNWKFGKQRDVVRRVVAEGIPGSAMPAAKPALSDADLNAVTDFVLELASQSPASQAEDLATALRKAGFQPASGRHVTGARFRQTGDGRVLSLDALRGRPVLVHFWGTHCAHCLARFPEMVALATELRSSGLEWISICADEDDPDIIERVVRPQVGQHPLYADESGLAVAQFQVQILPMFVLLDGAGNWIGTRSGGFGATADELRILLELCR